MLSLAEVLEDAAQSPAFEGLKDIQIHSRGKNDETPLHWMATLGDEHAIRLLVSQGADVDAQDRNGDTPLHEAIRLRHRSAAMAIMEVGGRTDIKNTQGITALALADLVGLELD